MLDTIYWHTPRITLKEDISEEGERTYDVSIIDYGLMSPTSIHDIRKALQNEEYKCAPMHYFIEDETAENITDKAYYIKREGKNGTIKRTRVSTDLVCERHMYMHSAINSTYELFTKLSLMSQFLQCTASLENVRPGISSYIDAALLDAERAAKIRKPEVYKKKRKRRKRIR